VVIIGHAEAMARSAHKALVIAGTALAAALLSIALLLIALDTGPVPRASDEARVRAVLERMNGSYNRGDFDAFASYVCPDMLRADGYKAGWYQSRNADGPTQITINSVDVAGGRQPHAVANVRFMAANHRDAKTLDVDFRRQGDDWKACRYVASQPV
jgi:ketosteroid isomerase-like protein